MFSIFFVFPFSSFFHILFLFLFFFFFQSSEPTPKPETKRRTVPTVKITISFCENSIFWVSVDRGERRSGKAHLRVTARPWLNAPAIPLFLVEQKVSSFVFFSCLSFKHISLLALVSEFNCRCFLRGRCSMEMWCPDEIGRDTILFVCIK